MKTALITGANKGIGFETARQLGKLGFKILLGARSQARGDEAAAKLAQEGIQADVVVLDVASPESIAAAADRLNAEMESLDVLVNNAGIWLEPTTFQDSNADTVPMDMFRATFETNVFGLIDLTQRLLPLIRKSEAGRIVNLSSILGSQTLHATPGSPIESTKVVAYNTSKSAVNMYTIHLAHALKGTGIKVNAAHPGWVQTDMGGPTAPMVLEDGAKTGVWLATLPDDGPTGGYFHMKDPLPW